MMFTPKRGKTETNKGNMAQWIAQATDVVMPSASQLIFDFIKDNKNMKKQQCCKIVFAGFLPP